MVEIKKDDDESSPEELSVVLRDVPFQQAQSSICGFFRRVFENMLDARLARFYHV